LKQKTKNLKRNKQIPFINQLNRFFKYF